MFEPSSELISFQKSLEGFHSKPYICPGGAPTIGYGTTFYPANGKDVTLQDEEISEKQAEEFLVTDLRNRIAAVISMIAWEPPKHVIEALVSLSRNIGLEALKNSSCMKAMNSGKGSVDERIQKAAVALKMWNKAKDPKTGELRILGGLVSRREDEFDIMMNGWNKESSSRQTAASVMENKPSIVNSGRARWGLLGLGFATLPAVFAALPQILSENPITISENGMVDWTSFIGMATALFMVIVRSMKEQNHGSFGSQGRAT